MKLLTFNANYFLGYNGSLKHYFQLPHRGVFGSLSEDRRIDQFAQLVKEEQPDFVFLQEIDQGSIRTRTDGQIGVLGSKTSELGMNYSYVSDNKYGSSVVRHLPIFKKMANGVMYRKGEVLTHHFPNGVKQLFHELRLENLSVFSVHLPLLRKARQKQLEHIFELAEKRENFILTGDFNVRDSEDVEKYGFNTAALDPTYPSCRPEHCLDRVIYSGNIDIEDCRVVEETVSDHKPVVCKFSY